MTEDEAKEKWCPMARVAYLQDPAFNRISGVERGQSDLSPQVSRCIGSKCMMWRQDLITFMPKRRLRAGFMPLPPQTKLDPDNGHCGLAR